MKTVKIVVDSDALISQSFEDDKNYKKAGSLLIKLNEINTYSLYPSTTLAETVTTVQRKFNNKKRANEIAKQFLGRKKEIIPVDHVIYSLAMKKYFDPRTSKKDTLFDAIVAAVAEKHKADAIFSFDSYYKRQGFKLVSELFK